MLPERINRFGNNLLLTFKKYPVSILFSLICAVVLLEVIDSENMIYDNTGSREQHSYFLLKMAYLSALGISLSFALSMLIQKRNFSDYLHLAALAIVAPMYLLFPKDHLAYTVKHAIFMILFFIMAHLLVAFIPYWREQKERKFWEYNKNLFVNLIVTGIFTAVLVGGLELAVVAIEQLFNVRFDDGLIYPKIAVFFGVFGSTMIFLLFSKKGFTQLQSHQDYPSVLKFFVQFILIPLLFIYCIILLLYGLKITLQWELPNGWVSALIIVYAFLGILALLLVHPLIENKSKSWVKWFSNIFYISLIPFTVLLFIAIGRRISDYGFTEKRYYVFLLAIWISLTTLYFLIRREGRIKFIPISLFFFALFSIVVPYFNVNQVALRSQKSLFHQNLKQMNVLSAQGKIDYNQAVDYNDLEQLISQFRFFQKRNKLHLIEPYTGLSIRNENRNVVYQFENQFTNVQHQKSPTPYSGLTIVQRNINQLIEINNYDFMVPQYGGHQTISLPENGNTLTYNRKKQIIYLQQSDEVIDEYFLGEWFQKLEEQSFNSRIDELRKTEFDLGMWTIELQLNSLHKYGNDVSNYNFSGVLFLKKNL